MLSLFFLFRKETTKNCELILALPFSCRCAILQRTTGVLMGSWACAFVESLLEELHVEAFAGAGQLLN